VDSILKQS